MKTRQLDVARRNFRLACLGGAVLVALAATTASQAATRADRGAAQQQYRADVQYCNRGQAGQPRALCLHEARQAYNEALRGGLDVPVMATGTRSTQSTAADRSGTGAGMDQGNRTGTSSATTGSGSTGSGSSYGGATSGGSGSMGSGSSSSMGSPNTGSASSGNSGSTSDRGQSGSAVSPNGGAPSGSTGR